MSSPQPIESAKVASAPASRFDAESLKRIFDQEGYVVLPGVVSRAELSKVEQGLAGAFAEWQRSTESFRGGGLISGHLNCYPGEIVRGVMQELRDTGTLALAQQLWPTDPNATRLGCNFNLPGSFPQHYHMDGLFLESYLVLNVAVVDTHLTNGAIDVIPKTHKRFYKYWEFATRRMYKNSTRLSMRQGDVILRLSTLWHRGMPNRSATPRAMVAITLGEKGVNNPDPFAYREGRFEFQTNWFNTSALGRLRERTAVQVPLSYSAYRFARSLIGNKGYATF